ncbi:MAG: hypothetical protein RL757_3387 [Bacteroidota bacterium]|jgi:hypothetical protein
MPPPSIFGTFEKKMTKQHKDVSSFFFKKDFFLIACEIIFFVLLQPLC